MGSNEGLQQIVLVLSVANVLCPLVFGFFMWKMSQVFVTKTQFIDLKSEIASANTANRDWQRRIDEDVLELLQRTADRR